MLAPTVIECWSKFDQLRPPGVSLAPAASFARAQFLPTAAVNRGFGKPGQLLPCRPENHFELARRLLLTGFITATAVCRF